MKYRFTILLVACALGLSWTYCASGEVVSSSEAATMFDLANLTRVRKIASTNDVLPFAYNCWAKGADEAWQRTGAITNAVTIRLTRMMAYGDSSNPEAWMEYATWSDTSCANGEDVCPATFAHRSYVRAELVDAEDAVGATAYFDCTQCEDLPDAPSDVRSFDVAKGLSFDTVPPAYQEGLPALANGEPIRVRQLGSFDRILPFAYDRGWFAGTDVEGISMTVEPQTSGETETLETEDIKGTNEWTTSVAQVYRVTLYATLDEQPVPMMAIDLDLSGAEEDFLELSDLPDSDETTGTIRIPWSWLDDYGLTADQVTNTTKKLNNGLPAWQSFVLGYNPTGDVLTLRANIAPVDMDQFRVWGEALSGAALTNYVNVGYRLMSTDELGTTFEKYDDDAEDPEFIVDKDGQKRFFRIRSVFFWNK